MPASAALSGPSDGSPHVAALERCPPSGLETLIQQTSPVASDRLWVVASHLHHSITVSDGEHRGERAPSRLTGPRAPPSPPARRPTHQRALWVARAAAPSPRDPRLPCGTALRTGLLCGSTGQAGGRRRSDPGGVMRVPKMPGRRPSGYCGRMPDGKQSLDVGGTTVVISNPGKVYFPQTGHTKLDLVRYYLAVADGALRGAAGRPNVLKRFVNGAGGEPFFQKRAPDKRPGWIDTVLLSFPSGRTAEEVVPRDAAALAWMVNLGCIDLNPHPVRAEDLDHPDELRVDLDPVPGVEWPQILRVALVARDVLSDFGLTGWPKTSGSRGFHIYARIEPRWGFTDVRRAAVALAREVERRAPDVATAQWWKEERHGVFVDYNQNAKDRTVASAYSVRPTPDARVSTPLSWPEVPDCDPAAFTIDT